MENNQPIGYTALFLNTTFSYSSAYVNKIGDFLVEAKITGKITIEHDGINKHKHNFDLIMSMNGPTFEQNLGQFNEKAFADLTKNVKLGYDFSTKKVTIQAPITYLANLGPIEVRVMQITPLQLSGSAKPKPISAAVEIDRRKYKYTAEIEWTVQVTYQPRPGQPNPEPVQQPIENKAKAEVEKFQHIESLGPAKNNEGSYVTVLIILIGIAASIAFPALRLQPKVVSPTGAASPILMIKDKRYKNLEA